MFIAQTIDVTATDEREIAPPAPSGATLKLVRACLMPATALGTDATNYLTITLKKGAGGTSLGAITTNSSGGEALVKGTKNEFSITATGTNLEFDADDCLELVIADAATTADFDGSLMVLWEVIRI